MAEQWITTGVVAGGGGGGYGGDGNVWTGSNTPQYHYTPATGTIYYQINDGQARVYSGNAWEPVTNYGWLDDFRTNWKSGYSDMMERALNNVREAINWFTANYGCSPLAIRCNRELFDFFQAYTPTAVSLYPNYKDRSVIYKLCGLDVICHESLKDMNFELVSATRETFWDRIGRGKYIKHSFDLANFELEERLPEIEDLSLLFD